MTRMQHVRRIIRRIPTDLRNALGDEPIAALTRAGLRVEPVPQLTSLRGAGGMCDGMSFSDHGAILYAPTPDSRRENFTVLHEYAHLLVDVDDDALSWLADQESSGYEQESMCDDIAAALLVSDDDLDRIVGSGPITGQHLVDLFMETEASQIVCAIALARRLGSSGAVILTDRRTHKVVHAAKVGHLAVYPSPNQDIPAGHPLRHIQPGAQICKESFWSTPWGERQPYYINAAATPKRTYCILAESDLWGAEKFHIPLPQAPEDLRPRQEIDCPCGFFGSTTGWPCSDCGRQFCPRCQSCDCDRRASRTERCARCGVNVARTNLVGGLCSGCR
jgi:hypothetical protein